MTQSSDNAGLTTRPVESSDRDWLIALRNTTMNPHLAASGIHISSSENAARVDTDYDHIRMVCDNAETIGMIKVLRNRTPWKLVQIQIDPARQNQGIGGQLVADLIEEARTAGVAVELSVLSVNPAKNLYARLGFNKVSERDGAIQMRYDPGGARSSQGEPLK